MAEVIGLPDDFLDVFNYLVVKECPPASHSRVLELFSLQIQILLIPEAYLFSFKSESPPLAAPTRVASS